MAAQELHQYKDIAYRLRKSDRKTTSIFIERDGEVSVIAPKPFDMQRIEQIIEKKRRWIYKNLAEWEDLNRTRVHREYVNGESFLYLGRNYRLNILDEQAKDEQSEALAFKNNQFWLKKTEIVKAPEHFKQFYKTRLQDKLKPRIKLYQAKMGLQAENVRILELKNRWGSCTSKGIINLHWKCAMLPMSVLDYIVVHELAHINHPNHSAAFWRTVEKVLPNYQEQKSWLKFNGAGMSL